LYSFWQNIISIVSIISINLKAQRSCPTLKIKTRNRYLSMKSNIRRTHYYSFIDKAKAEFYISSFNTRLNQLVEYNAVARWKSYVTRSWG